MSRATRQTRQGRVTRSARRTTLSPRTLPMPLKRERVLRAIADLPEDQRLLLSLCIVEGLTPAETAELTGLSSRAVSAACDRLLLVLRRALSGAARRRRNSAAVARTAPDAAPRRAM